MSVKSIAKKAFKANAITEEEYKQLLCVIRLYYKSLRPHDWIKVKDQLPVVPEGKSLVDVLVVAKVYFTPDHVDQRDWTYVVEKATYEPKYGFYGNNIRNYNVKEWMYAPEMPKRYARYVWREEE